MTNEEIDKMISQLEELKTEKPSQIIIPDCGWMFYANGKIEKSHWPKDFLEKGNKRTTREACKLASKRMIRTNRLSLLAHILGVEKEFVSGEDNYYVFRNTYQRSWIINHSINFFHPDRVYMPREGAESICTILNNDEWNLEVDDD